MLKSLTQPILSSLTSPLTGLVDGFTPVSLGATIWIDANNVSESGGTVTGWTDLAGFGNGASQGTVSMQAVLSTGADGFPEVVFDGVDDHYEIANDASIPFIPQTDEWTNIIVVGDNPGYRARLFCKGLFNENGNFLMSRFNDIPSCRAGAASSTAGAGATSLTKYVHEQRVSTTVNELFVDGVSKDTGVVGSATTTNTATIGAVNTTDFTNRPYEGGIRAVITIPRVITTAEATQLYAFIATEYNV